MIRTAIKSVTVIAGFMLLGSSVLHADSLGPSTDRRHKPSRPSVTTYATGLTNPRGLTFGPDGKLYVAEAGTGGTLTPKGGPDCPVDINVFSPYKAGFSGRVVRVRRDGNNPSPHVPHVRGRAGTSHCCLPILRSCSIAANSRF
jgi:hypothetical protein